MFKSATRISVFSSKARLARVVIRVLATGLRTAAKVVIRVSGVVIRAAAKVVTKAARVIVRETKAVSMAKMDLGLSLPAQWAINLKLGQTTETRLATRSSANALKESPPAVAAKQPTDRCRAC